ncbi:MAG: glycosyl hydrolase, partial [Proteobacteria bacterium]|nr:glycosyl hydrolase [Pseudomonadota bacterium]
GLALGQEGWILRTDDGGQSWTETAFTEKNGEPLMSAARLPNGDWLAVGAFGQVLRSIDDRNTWQPDTLPGLSDWHLNQIASSADGKQWMIVGENGTVLRSTDGARSWEAVEPFYHGSLYGAVHLGGNRWVAYGMRGKVFFSDNAGETWSAAQVPAPVSLYGHTLTPSGELLLVGQGGVVLSSKDGGEHFTVARRGGRASLTGILVKRDGEWLMSSDGGLRAFTPKAHEAGTNQPTNKGAA